MPDTRPNISYKFNTPLEFKGRAILEGFKIQIINQMTRDSAIVYYYLGYFSEDSNGYELDFQPIGNVYELRIDGQKYIDLLTTVATAGTTLEQLIITEAYRAIVISRLEKGEDWRGKVRVSNTVSLLTINTAPTQQ